MITRAATYARISQDKTGAGLGVDRQRADCAALAASHGWTVVEVFEDNDVSAYSGKPRPGYEALLAGIADGRFDVVLAWHTDRLHRRPIELEHFIEVIDKARVNVHTVQAGQINLSSHEGKLAARMFGSMAAYESGHRSDRILRKHQELRQNGALSGGGSRAWGYDKTGMQVLESEAQVIRDVTARIIAGETMGSCIRWLNSEGHTTTTGGPWRTTTFKRAITSARLCAWRESDGQWITQGVWPAILTRAQTEQIRAALANPARTHSGPARKYLLSGLLRCSHCGAGMLGAPNDRGDRRYRCVPVPVGRGCGKTFIKADDVEAEIVAQVLDVITRGNRIAQESTNPDVSVLTEALAKDERALVDLGEDYDDGLLQRVEYLARRRRLTDRIEATRAQILKASDQTALVGLVGMTGEQFQKHWTAQSLASQRLILDAVLDGVTVLPAVRGRNKFDPDRLQASWKA